MAKRMALVPESWLQQQPTPEPGPSTPSTIVRLVEPEAKEDLSSLATLMPKSYRSKARILLHYLDGHVKLNTQQRVLYPPNNQVGSHIVDLVKYYVSPFASDRPIDAPKFAKLMSQAGVPKSAIAKKTQQFKWHKLV